jgi:DSF synthase
MTYVSHNLPNSFQADHGARSQAVFPGPQPYLNLECHHDVPDHSFWCYLNPAGRPSFTEPLLADLHDVQAHIASLAAPIGSGRHAAVNWVILASKVPGIFSLGGDLTVFSRKIRAGDAEGLRQYAYSCVDISYRNATGYGGKAISIGLAQGEALGGGFESLLSCDVIVAEKRSRFGLPEVLMNLFPGMGAHAFLTRRIGSAAAMKLILSGQVFTAEAMHAMGVVDLVVDDGTGEDEVRQYIARNASRHHAHAAIYKARRVTSPVSLETLREVTDIWVDTAMALTDKDLRRMGHLVSAQDRSLRQHAPHMAVAAE